MHAEELRAGHCPLTESRSANAPCVHVLFRFVKGDYILDKGRAVEQVENDRPALISSAMIEAGASVVADFASYSDARELASRVYTAMSAVQASRPIPSEHNG